MKNYILALDEGTTSARAILFDLDGNIVSVARNEFSQIFPKPGWVEHDPLEIYASQYAAMTECIAQSSISPDEIAAAGITNQRETTIVWDKNTGKPVYNAIGWQCRRTTDMCEKLIKDGRSDEIKKSTGLMPDAYFSATKIRWILDNVENAREMAESGDLLFGTVDSWLIWKLTGGKVHITDRTNASRTMLYNIHENRWDDRILRMLDIPLSMMPEVRSSSEIYAEIDVMGSSVPIGGIAGDQQSALFGQGCFNEGDIKTTYGTGCFMLMNTGDHAVESKHGLITTVAATQKDKPYEYVLEGSVFIGGAIIQWIRDKLGIITDSLDSEYFASKISDTGGVYIVPAFSGLGAPYWDMDARGIITGITRGTGRNQIIRAALESIAFQTDDVMKAMSSDLGRPVKVLKVDGGASANDLLMQFQSDISDAEVLRPQNTEATAAGVAFLAGMAAGIYKDRNDVSQHIRKTVKFSPSMTEKNRKEELNGWHNAVKACQILSKMR